MADSGIRTNFSKTFVNEQVPVQYPYIFIPRFGEEIALMVECVRPGELPIVLPHAGTLKKVGSCSLSALELSKLSRVYKFEMVLSKTERREITSITDIMEVISWMASLASA